MSDTMESRINTFNEVGTRIWELADGSLTVCDIATRIEQEYEIDHKTALKDTRTFVDELLEKRMLTVRE
ncbi:PqqD family protein [candidate division KSB1 bacterium]|nr:PqqD family protein [candidate division KSB1 bacterium]